jgi:hypothetical protein
MDIVALLISIVINTIIISPMLWLAGRALVGKEKAKFTDAIWIALLGTVIGAIVGYFIGGIIAVIIFVVISFILALIGIAIIATWL